MSVLLDFQVISMVGPWNQWELGCSYSTSRPWKRSFKEKQKDWISRYFFGSSSDKKCDCSLFGWPLIKPRLIIPFLFLKLKSEHHWFFEQLFFISLDVVTDYDAWKFSYLPFSAYWNAKLPKELKEGKNASPMNSTVLVWVLGRIKPPSWENILTKKLL